MENILMEGAASVPPKSHNLGRARIRRDRWCGMDVLHIRQEVLPGRSWHDISAERPMFSMVVREIGGRCESRLSMASPTPPVGEVSAEGHCSLVPARVPVWGYSDNIMAFEEVRIFLEPETIATSLGDDLPAAALNEPRLMIFDHDLRRLAHLIAGSAAEPGRSALWSESLLLAAISRLTGLGLRSRAGARPNGLSARQIRHVTQYIQENLDQPIRLGDLSAVVGLSASQFARSFKVSTGETPHRWLLNARIERAKAMLLDRRNRLAEVALATGFSEQSHFTRAFVAANGVPPGRWRRSLAA